MKDIDAKLSGDNDLDWSEIKDKYGIKCNSDTIRKASATIFGGKFRNDYLKSQIYSNPEDFSKEKELNKKIEELRKERIKLSDARTDYNKLIRQEARKESYADMVKRVICENVEPIEFDYVEHIGRSVSMGNDLLVHVTDIHTGIEIESWNNRFNQSVLKDRIEEYTNQIISIGELHDSENCYVVIGEVVSGIIHNNLRLQNNMDLMEQFKYISELISTMLSRLSGCFNEVHVYVTPGNHSRISPKKEDSLDGENMDLLLPFYLKARLQNFKNIFIEENKINPEIAMFNIRGVNVFAAHGHKDAPSNVVQNFTLMFGIKPDIVLLGHRHTNGMSTVFNAKIIESGSVSGADVYATSIRKDNRPEQTVSVINSDGLVCLYDIQLN